MSVQPAGEGAALSSKKSFRERFPRAYTSAPPLRDNAIVATLQLFAWLFFRPAAWCGHIARIEPSLPSDFSLAQLSAAQLRNPAVRRLLFLGHVLAPSLIGVLLAIELLLLHVPPRFVIIRVLACVFMSIGGSLIFATGSAAAIGIAAGMMGGLIGCAAFAIAVAISGQVVFSLPSSVSAMIKDFLAGGTGGITTLTVTFGIAMAGMFVGVGGVGAGVSARRAQLSKRPNLGGLLLGLFIGAIMFTAAVSSAILLPFAVAISAGGFFAGVVSALWLTRNVARSVVFGIACALNNHFLVNIVAPLTHDVIVVGIIMGIILGAWFGLPYIIAEEIGGTWSGAVAGSLGFAGGWLLTLSAASRQHMFIGTHILPGLFSLETAVLLGLTDALWRPLIFFPLEEAWNLILLRLDRSSTAGTSGVSFLRWHSAFWDEHQRLPLYGLTEHLLLVVKRNPEEGRMALEQLSSGRQRWAAQAVQIELDVQRLESCGSAQDIARAHRELGIGDLEGPASALLRRLGGFSQDIEAALSQSTSHNQRLGLRTVQQRLEVLLSEVDRSSDRYAVRVRPIVASWQKIIARHAQELAETVELKQELDNPYIIGVPLTLEQELFVGRTDVSARIEQLLLDRRRPPLLLYGQRRMGKTSLLNNLGRLLPSTIIPLFVDMQGPASSASDHAGLLYNLARSMIESARKQRGLALPPLPREALTADPFTTFDEWLDKVEACLGDNTALLTLDEFDALEWALTSGRFDEQAVLGMLRHIVQHRQRIKMLIAGSHTLEELSRWASYLINVQVVQVGYLGSAEARRLIEQPVKDMALRYEPKACDRVLELTRGHPFLVQLLCAEIVAWKNEQDPAVRRLATLADVHEAVSAALQHGSFFFVDIERNQIDANGLQVLRVIAAQGEGTGASTQAIKESVKDANLDSVLPALLRRDVIEQTATGYRFQVELIRRWFAQSVGLAARGSN